MIWSDEHTTEFKRLAETGISYAEVAGAMNEKFGLSVTRNSCIGKANRLGLQRSENRYCGLSAIERRNRAEAKRSAYFKQRGADRKAARWAAKPWLEARAERLKERIERAKEVRATCASKTSPTYRKNLPRAPEMTKSEMMAMLRAAVENTRAPA